MLLTLKPDKAVIYFSYIIQIIHAKPDQRESRESRSGGETNQHNQPWRTKCDFDLKRHEGHSVKYLFHHIICPICHTE